MKQIVHAASPHDCPDACGVMITVDHGRATRIQGDPDNFLTFCNVPSVQEMEEAGLLEMSAADAQARRIVDGEVVRVFKRRGDIHLKARVDGAVRAGVMSAKLHWANLSPGRRNINVLTSEKLTDLGNSATFYSVLVEVELFKPA